ncbi:YcnI family protein [Micromonospora sp. NBC_00898]|uniref:YcnI family copper-binding membrane protein n=1 Tax=Micromonospora sp. NBC_00898 TaxID=2975981 RepID=UPI003862D527|nr:YcnI family protein [Micromonospora sp. NBC_00898]
MLRTHVLRAGAAAAGAVTAILAFAGPAFAHVTVNPKEATQGGYTKVTFRVPNEKDNANTTKVEVNLPTSTPIASVSLKPLAGWTAQTETSKLATPIKTDDGEITEAITKITWTADANAAIKPGQFQEFDVSLGPLPEADQVVFKALQTYSDGDVVRWIDEPSNGAEPEHPAPVLKLAKKGAATPAAAPVAVANTADSSDGESANGTAIGFGVGGLVLGLAGLAAGLLAYRKASRAG